jgi:phosphomannomutase
MLKRYPGAIILYNLICSKAVAEVIDENGGVGVRTRVGHSYIKQVMADTGAVFGGEHSGHYYFRENFCADSGIITALVVLALMSEAAKPLSELVRPFDRYAASGEINTEVANPSETVATITSHLKAERVDIDELDGLSADFGSWRFNLRPSNTEPLLRLNVEALDEVACHLHVTEVLAMIEGA